MAPSGIREIMQEAWTRADPIRLEYGEPDFPTAQHIIEAAHSAAQAGHTRYTPTQGIPALLEALADKVARRNNFCVGLDQIIIGNGGVETLYACLLVLAEPGDEVLIPDPGWPNFTMMAAMQGLSVVRYPLEAENGFIPAIADLERLITPRTRVIIVNSPSNPLGSVIGRTRMEQLVELASRHDLWMLSDECYDEIVFESEAISPSALDPDGRIISVYSFSKTYAMTGWRLGYATAPQQVAELLAKAQEPLVSSLNEPTQYAALAALSSPPSLITKMVDAYRQRRDTAFAYLTDLGMTAYRPAGSFYMWVSIAESGLDSRTFALRLLEEQNVGVAPGSTFGPRGQGFIRLSLATSESALIEGSKRLALFWDQRRHDRHRTASQPS
jgi:aspartate/methionine/tyrosine aminotransferase